MSTNMHSTKAPACSLPGWHSASRQERSAHRRRETLWMPLRHGKKNKKQGLAGAGGHCREYFVIARSGSRRRASSMVALCYDREAPVRVLRRPPRARGDRFTPRSSRLRDRASSLFSPEGEEAVYGSACGRTLATLMRDPRTLCVCSTL